MDDQNQISGFLYYGVPFMFSFIIGVAAMQFSGNNVSTGLICFAGALLSMMPGAMLMRSAMLAKEPLQVNILKEKPATVAMILVGTLLFFFGFPTPATTPFVLKIIVAVGACWLIARRVEKEVNNLYEIRRKDGFK